MNTEQLRKLTHIMAALIDTTHRTTDLENVYNDNTGQSYSWDEVFSAYNDLLTYVVSQPSQSG